MGPYAAGSQTIFLHDESRPLDACGGERRGVRTLVTELWYPVDVEQAERKRANSNTLKIRRRSRVMFWLLVVGIPLLMNLIKIRFLLTTNHIPAGRHCKALYRNR